MKGGGRSQEMSTVSDERRNTLSFPATRGERHCSPRCSTCFSFFPLPWLIGYSKEPLTFVDKTHVIIQINGLFIAVSQCTLFSERNVINRKQGAIRFSFHVLLFHFISFICFTYPSWRPVGRCQTNVCYYVMLLEHNRILTDYSIVYQSLQKP